MNARRFHALGRTIVTGLALFLVFGASALTARAAQVTIPCGDSVNSNKSSSLRFRFTNEGDCSARVEAFSLANQSGTVLLDITIEAERTVEINRDDVAQSFRVSAVGGGVEAMLISNALVGNKATDASYWARAGEDAYNANLGNVGIGTATPAAKLDVAGSIAVSGQPVIDDAGRFVGSTEGLATHNPKQLAMLRWYDANESGITYTVGGGAFGFAFDGQHMWVASAFTNTVTKLRASDGETVGAFAVGNGPRALAYDGAHVWVVNQIGGTVMKLRASDGAILDTIAVGALPSAIAFDGANVWVTNQDSANVMKIRASDGTVLGTFPVGTWPRGIAFDGANVWITNSADNTVTQLRASDGALLNTIAVGSFPFGITFDGTNMWVSNTFSNTMTKLRASDGTVVDTIATDAPVNAAFDGSHIWVPNNAAATVTKIRAVDGTIVGSYAVDTDPEYVAFDGANIWVSSEPFGTVKKL